MSGGDVLYVAVSCGRHTAAENEERVYAARVRRNVRVGLGGKCADERGALAHAAGRGAGVPLVFYIAGTVVAFWSFVLKAEKSEEKKDEALYGGNADKRDGKDNKPQAENGKNESTGRAA